MTYSAKESVIGEGLPGWELLTYIADSGCKNSNFSLKVEVLGYSIIDCCNY
jgi:hypothetical protein